MGKKKGRLSTEKSAPPPMEAPSSEPELMEVVPLPDPAATPAPPSPPAAPAVTASPTKTKYPAMMVSGSSGAHAAVLASEEFVDEDLGPLAPPRFLRPADLHSAEDVEARAQKFNESFAPLATLTADDVVVGCSAHGSEYVAQSKEHLSKFNSHVRAVDLAHGPGGFVQSLEAGELCQLPVAVTKGAIGLTFYGSATVARFTPALARAVKSKLEEWRVVDKAKIVKTAVVAKTTEVASKAVDNAKKGWKWLKAKIDEKRNGGGLPLTEKPSEPAI